MDYLHFSEIYGDPWHSVIRLVVFDPMEFPPVFFDIGDTLVFARRTLHELVTRLCLEAGCDVTEETVRHTAHRLAQTMERASTLDLELFKTWWFNLYRCLLLELNYPASIDTAQQKLWEAWRKGEALRLYPGAVDILERLRNAGVRLGIISNWDDTLPNVLERLGIADFFEVCVVSCEVGYEKPHARIFEIAAERLPVNGYQPWYVGDRIDKDVQGALSVGWRPILVDHFHHYPSHSDGYELVRDLPSVADIILSSPAG